MYGKFQAENRVPDILDRRVVVDGRSPEQSVAVDVDLLCDAYVRIIPGEAVADAVPRSLNECAKIVGDPAAGKRLACCKTKLLLTPKPGGDGGARLSCLRIRKSRLQHDCKRWAFPPPPNV